jgi:septal ring factor EnvC (AmiA/AmiB activator)
MSNIEGENKLAQLADADATPSIEDQFADLNADLNVLSRECRAMAERLVMIEVRLDSIEQTTASQTQLLEAIRQKLNNLANGLGVY